MKLIDSSRSRRLARRIRKPLNYLVPSLRPESVYFFTFHKCASSFFGSYVLDSVERLEHVNVDELYYHSPEVEGIPFRPRGYVYGPLRLSSRKPTEAQRRTHEQVTAPEYVRDKRLALLVRDPRDIAISAYFSFGFSHGLSPVEEVRLRQQKRRAMIQNQDMEEVVTKMAVQWRNNFEEADKLLRNCPRCVLLKYEDMIDDWETFERGLCEVFEFRKATLRKIYEKSRPPEKEDVTSHRRSGKTGDFRQKLSPETIETLNDILGPTLDRFGYER